MSTVDTLVAALADTSGKIESTVTLYTTTGSSTAWLQLPLQIVTPPVENTLPPGTNWAGFMAAYTAAAPGSVIRLANEPLHIMSQLQGTKPVKIRGSGPQSKLI